VAEYRKGYKVGSDGLTSPERAAQKRAATPEAKAQEEAGSEISTPNRILTWFEERQHAVQALLVLGLFGVLFTAYALISEPFRHHHRARATNVLGGTVTHATGNSVAEVIRNSFAKDPNDESDVAGCTDEGYTGYSPYAQMNGEVYRCSIEDFPGAPYVDQCYVLPDNDIEFFRSDDHSAVLVGGC